MRNQILQPNDILFATKGSVGKTGLVPHYSEFAWMANQSFQILRLRHNLYITYSVVLFRYLNSLAAQALIQARTGGSGVKLIQTGDVKAPPVIVPSAEEQAAIVEEHQRIVLLYAKIAQLRSEADKLLKSRWAL